MGRKEKGLGPGHRRCGNRSGSYHLSTSIKVSHIYLQLENSYLDLAIITWVALAVVAWLIRRDPKDMGLLPLGVGNFSISWGICRAIRHNKAYIKSGSMGMSFFAPCP